MPLERKSTQHGALNGAVDIERVAYPIDRRCVRDAGDQGR